MTAVAKVRWPVIVVLSAVGVVWLGQGIGVIGGSFMSGEPLWAIIGAVMLVGAGVLTVAARRGR
jgi:F0F1-type ATP synthase assembly protein I